MRRAFSLSTLVTLFLLSEFGGAQVVTPPKHRKWEFSVFAGGSFPSDESLTTPVEGSGEEKYRVVALDYSSGGLFGVRVGENLGDHLGADLEYSFANRSVAFVNLSPELPFVGVEQGVHSIVYNVLYYPFKPTKRFRPFGLFGGGTSFYHVAGSSKDAAAHEGLALKDRWEFAVNWGVGAKYLLVDQWVARVDLRQQFAGVPDYGFPDTASDNQGELRPGLYTSGMTSNWQLSVGIAYQWDMR